MAELKRYINPPSEQEKLAVENKPVMVSSQVSQHYLLRVVCSHS